MTGRPLTEEGLLHVVCRMRAGDREEILATRWTDDLRELVALFWHAGPLKWEYGPEGAPVACIGVSERWPGVWQAWMFATDDFNKVGKMLTRFAKRTIMPAVSALGAHRVQAHSAEFHVEAHRWLESLGAVHESTMPRFGRNGETFRCYRWVRV